MNPLKKLSLKIQLTLLFVMIFTGSLLVFSAFLYREYSENRISEFDANLYNYAIDVAESLDVDSYGAVEFDPSIIKLNEKILPFSMGKSFIAVFDIYGKVVAHSQNAQIIVNELLHESILMKVLKKGSSFSNFIGKDGESYRVIYYLLPVLKVDSPLILQIAVPTNMVEQSKRAFKRFLIFSSIIILFFSCLIGLWFTRKAFMPIVEITNKANLIEAHNLKERVPVPKNRDEIWKLATTINHLLERLDKSFNAQERFVEDASHQLKTPLAIIKGELDLFKSGQKKETDLNNFLESISQEMNSLIKLTNDLLILAKVDNAENALAMSIISIEEVVASQVMRLSKLSALKNINLHISMDESQNLKVLGDTELLGVLFYNLIENAIKYSPVDSRIEIKISSDEKDVFISVIDNGVGIKADHAEKIFDRFYRGENSNKYQGSGLGLAICKAVSNLHNAQIKASRNTDLGTTILFKIQKMKESV